MTADELDAKRWRHVMRNAREIVVQLSGFLVAFAPDMDDRKEFEALVDSDIEGSS